MKILDLPIPRSMAKAVPDLYIKNRMLRECAGGVETLIFGHSQGGHGFNPAYFPHSFNLCSRSQDAKMSYFLYKKFGATLPKLKRVVLFYSIISPGFLTEREKTERMVAVAFNAIYKLGMPFEDDYLDLLCADIEGLFDKVDWDYKADGYEASAGYVQDQNIEYFENTYWQRRRLPQLHAFNALDDVDHYLGKTIALAKERGHKIYFAVAPNRSDTLKGIPGTSAYLHRHLLDALPKFNLRAEDVFSDLYCDPRFPDEGFADFTHLILGSKGTELLTKTIREMVERAEGRPV